MSDDIHSLLHKVQIELNAPRDKINKFAGYSYRSCEGILEAVKKVLPLGASVTIADDIKMIGERYYVQATASFNIGGASVQSIAYAREPLEKKGSDASQITGATSSYARKYALNGLFAIDDSKDSDETNTHSGETGHAKLHDMTATLYKLMEYKGSNEIESARKVLGMLSPIQKEGLRKILNPEQSEWLNFIRTGKHG